MPLYDYQCKACGTVTEVRHDFREVHTGACPSCAGVMTRVFHPAGIVFKGSGFYKTDSRKSSASSGSSASSEPAKTETPSSETAKSEPAKTDASPAPAKNESSSAA